MKPCRFAIAIAAALQANMVVTCTFDSAGLGGTSGVLGNQKKDGYESIACPSEYAHTRAHYGNAVINVDDRNDQQRFQQQVQHPTSLLVLLFLQQISSTLLSCFETISLSDSHSNQALLRGVSSSPLSSICLPETHVSTSEVGQS